MTINTIKFNHTVWWNGQDKHIRMNLTGLLSPDYTIVNNNHNTVIINSDDPNPVKETTYTSVLKTVNILNLIFNNSNIPFNYPINDYDSNKGPVLLTIKDKKYLDITLNSFWKMFNMDGEVIIELNLGIYNGDKKNADTYSTNSNYPITLIIPIRSITKEPTEYIPYVNNRVKKSVLFNGTTRSDKDLYDYSFDIVDMDVSDQYITYSDAKELAKDEANVALETVQYVLLEDVKQQIKNLETEFKTTINQLRKELHTSTPNERPSE
jgi:hypothetical protein